MRVYTIILLLAVPGGVFAAGPNSPCASATIGEPGLCIGQNCNAAIAGQSVSIGDNVRITQTGHVDGAQITIRVPTRPPTPPVSDTRTRP